jgi:hypothetical protein
VKVKFGELQAWKREIHQKKDFLPFFDLSSSEDCSRFEFVELFAPKNRRFGTVFFSPTKN